MKQKNHETGTGFVNITVLEVPSIGIHYKKPFTASFISCSPFTIHL